MSEAGDLSNNNNTADESPSENNNDNTTATTDTGATTHTTHTATTDTGATAHTTHTTQAELPSPLPAAACVAESETSPSPSTTTTATTTASPTETLQQKMNSAKVDILLKATGDAPIMKKKKWQVDRTKRISWVSEFIKKYIKSDPSDSLFLYVNQAFAPSPDTDIGSVFDCFGSDGKLVLHYCRTQAWG